MHARLRSYMRREPSCEPQVSFQKDLILILLPGHFAGHQLEHQRKPSRTYACIRSNCRKGELV